MTKNEKWKVNQDKLMQQLLCEQLRTLSRTELCNLKKRFVRKFCPDDPRIMSSAHERFIKLTPLSDAFSVNEQKTLLTLLVPSDVHPEVIKGEHWRRYQQSIVHKHFLSRFEGTNIDVLRQFLDNNDDCVPVGMVFAEESLKDHRETVKVAIKKLLKAQKDINTRLGRCYKERKDMERAKDPVGQSIMKSILDILRKQATTFFADGSSTYAEPSAMYMNVICKSKQHGCHPRSWKWCRDHSLVFMSVLQL